MVDHTQEYDCGLIEDSIDGTIKQHRVFATCDTQFPNQLGQIELIDPETGQQVFLGVPAAARARYPQAVAAADSVVQRGGTE